MATGLSQGEENSLSEEHFFMALAFLASTRSKDGDMQVGACLVVRESPKEDPSVRDPLILAGLGYNGMPDGPGFKDSEMQWFKSDKTRESEPDKKNFVCHAEMNAIISAFRRQANLSKSTLYVTHSPCFECCKLIIQCGIKKMCWANDYHQTIEGYMKPIREDAKKMIDGKEKFLAVQQCLVPLPDGQVTLEQYEGEKLVTIDLGPPPGKSSKNKITHCKAEMKGNEQVKEEGNGQGKRCNEIKKGGEKGAKEGLTGKGEREVNLSKDDLFMAIAKLATIRSTSKTTKVGACLVTEDPHRAISFGYNECYKADEYKVKEVPYCIPICAGSNAIMNAFRAHADLTSSVLYVTSPLCHHCAKIIVQSGVKAVIYFQESQDSKDKEVARNQDPKNEEAARNQDLRDKKAVNEIFHRARIPYLEYRRQTDKRRIEIDLDAKDFNLIEVDD